MFRAVHLVISDGLVLKPVSYCSDAGSAVALAEMAMAAAWVAISLRDVPREDDAWTTSRSCSPSDSAVFLLEVPRQHHAALADRTGTLPWGRLGEVGSSPLGTATVPPRLAVTGLDGSVVIEAQIGDLKEAWQQPCAGQRIAGKPGRVPAPPIKADQRR